MAEVLAVERTTSAKQDMAAPEVTVAAVAEVEQEQPEAWAAMAGLDL